MAPRHFTNPPPRTESARELRATFFCDLCNKGYSRMNEFDEHLRSYLHQHAQRAKGLEGFMRDTKAAYRTERKEEEIMTVKSLGSVAATKKKTGGGGFKKGGFKSAFAPADDQPTESKPIDASRPDAKARAGDEDAESDLDEAEYDLYDFRRPNCTCRECPAFSAEALAGEEADEV